MFYVLQLCTLFIFGAVTGWLLEFFYRRLNSHGPWKNPGFLNGPWLPIYGFGTIILYFFSSLVLSLWIKIVGIVVFMTLLELVVGFIFTTFYQVRLWDYSNQFLNFKGYICPLYSLFWGILGTLFMFFIYPFLNEKLAFLMNHLEVSFVLGILYGFIIVDLVSSFGVLAMVKDISHEAEEKVHKLVINYDKLRNDLRLRVRENEKRSVLGRFILPFHGQQRARLSKFVMVQKNQLLDDLKIKRKGKSSH